MRWKNINRHYASHLRTLAAMEPRALLGVAVDATREEIRRAYLAKVKAYHPDLSDPFMVRHNQEVLKLINVAFEKLRAYR
jgi:curved DNA-binding protein CbpA